MSWKHGGLAAVLVCASAVLCYAHSYTWTGASSDAWNQSSNWTTGTCLGNECWPQTTGDDAAVPYAAGGYDIDLVEEEIDDLSIAGDAVFGDGSTDSTLTVDSATLYGASGSGATVRIFEGATIETR